MVFRLDEASDSSVAVRLMFLHICKPYLNNSFYFFFIPRKSSKRVLSRVRCAGTFSSRTETVSSKHCLQP